VTAVQDPQDGGVAVGPGAQLAGVRDNITVVIADAVHVASRQGAPRATDDMDVDTRPREAAGGVR
jgi:protein phosphatase